MECSIPPSRKMCCCFSRQGLTQYFIFTVCCYIITFNVSTHYTTMLSWKTEYYHRIKQSFSTQMRNVGSNSLCKMLLCEDQLISSTHTLVIKSSKQWTFWFTTYSLSSGGWHFSGQTVFQCVLIVHHYCPTCFVYSNEAALIQNLLK